MCPATREVLERDSRLGEFQVFLDSNKQNRKEIIVKGAAKAMLTQRSGEVYMFACGRPKPVRPLLTRSVPSAQ
ncbi:hypothetical protein J6590_016808 [Homalodisca vitripennis]|nr:hypothetical protein J6590_016808 [Homalodisca vitripennis]